MDDGGRGGGASLYTAYVHAHACARAYTETRRLSYFLTIAYVPRMKRAYSLLHRGYGANVSLAANETARVCVCVCACVWCGTIPFLAFLHTVSQAVPLSLARRQSPTNSGERRGCQKYLTGRKLPDRKISLADRPDIQLDDLFFFSVRSSAPDLSFSFIISLNDDRFLLYFFPLSRCYFKNTRAYHFT